MKLKNEEHLIKKKKKKEYGYTRNVMFITFLQQIISGSLLLVSKQIIFMKDSIITNNN